MRRVLAITAAVCAAAGCAEPAFSGTPESGAPGPEWSTVVESCPGRGQSVVVRQVRTADVTKDGVPDQVVIRGCRAPSGYWPSTIEVFDGAAGPSQPRRIGTLLRGDRDWPWVTEVGFIKDVIAVEAHGRSGRGPSECADLRVTYRFSYTDKGFRLIWRDANRTGDCLPTG
ncbi:hypothetical protein ACQPZJ_30060 [Actinoplanes sp. CA-054009]